MTQIAKRKRPDETRQLPEECSPSYLRSMHDDLADFSDKRIVEHFHRFGRSEGRAGSELAFREHFIDLVRNEPSVLEIGPFYSPVVAGPHVRYFDVLTSEQLHERASSLGHDTDRIPEQIHFVSPMADLSIVDERFDAVVSSHAIEHQPDLVSHLNLVSEILRPGGTYYLLVPNRRFCFDWTINESTLADVLQAHHEKRRVHTLSSVIEHIALTTHNYPDRHWRGDHERENPSAAALHQRVRQAIALHEAAGGDYIDVHAWQFTPESFRELMTGLNALDLSPFEVLRVYDTPYGRNEFTAVLRKT